MNPKDAAPNKTVRHFRQILLWPLQLMPIQESAQIQKHWELLERVGQDNPWHEVEDEFTGDPTQFQERHYNEFITFLPHVQRFLYGEGKGRTSRAGAGESPIRVFRREDIAKVRMTYRQGEVPLDFDVAHVDLYFFYDIDVVVLVVEVHADDLSLERVQDTLYRFGRAYPPFWRADGSGSSCLQRVQWLSAQAEVLATSDYERREKYLAFVCQYRSPCIASHWEFLLEPLVLHHSSKPGPIRYRQIEYHRMPLMAYLAIDDPRALTRTDFIRLALVTAPDGGEALPFSDRHLLGFEHSYCYDRFWSEVPGGPSTRYMSCGQALVVVGSAQQDFFVGREIGVLSQFRHQHFLLYLIAHFHKAALLMLSDRLVHALNHLDIQDPESVRRFKRTIRQSFEIFLRFTHRYWFHDIADQAQTRDLFRMSSEHLGTERLYGEVEDEIQKMSDYLDSDALRRQANTVVRLTVVTTFGLIATVTTGFLGMNLIAEAEAPLILKLLYFILIAVPATLLTLYAVLRSKRLSDFLETLSDDRLSMRAKYRALGSIFRDRQKTSA